MPLITQSEYARRQGFSRQYVNKLINKGRIRLVDGLIDSEATLAPLATLAEDQANLNFSQSRFVENTGKTENLNELLARVRLKNEIERGKILEAKAKAEINKLASIEKVRKTALAKAMAVREKVLNVPKRVSATLASINNSSRIREILEKELRNAMEEELDGNLDKEAPD
jgi:hypothetical protein